MRHPVRYDCGEVVGSDGARQMQAAIDNARELARDDEEIARGGDGA